MPFTLSDSSANQQRMQIDNNARTEFGQSTPNAPLSFRGRQLLASTGSSDLAAQVARPAGMARFTGSVSLVPGGQATITCGPSAGLVQRVAMQESFHSVQIRHRSPSSLTQQVPLEP